MIVVQILSLLLSCGGGAGSTQSACVAGSERRQVLGADWIRSIRGIDPAEIDESDIDIPRPDSSGFWEPWNASFSTSAGHLRRLFAAEVHAPAGAMRLVLETGWKKRLFKGDSLRIYLNGFLAGSAVGNTDSAIQLDGTWLRRGSKNDLLLVAVSRRSDATLEFPRIVSLPDTSLRSMKYATFGEFGFGYAVGGSQARLLKIPAGLLLHALDSGSAKMSPYKPRKRVRDFFDDTDSVAEERRQKDLADRFPNPTPPDFGIGEFRWPTSDVHWYSGWHRHRRVFGSRPGSLLEIVILNSDVCGAESFASIHDVVPEEVAAGFLRSGKNQVEVRIHAEPTGEEVCESIDSTDPSRIVRSWTLGATGYSTSLHWESPSLDSSGRFLGRKSRRSISWMLKDDTLRGHLLGSLEYPPSMDNFPPESGGTVGSLELKANTAVSVLGGAAADSVEAVSVNGDPNGLWYFVGDIGKIELGSLRLDGNRIRTRITGFAPYPDALFDGLADAHRPWKQSFDTVDFAWDPRSERDSLVRCGLRIETLDGFRLFGGAKLRRGSTIAILPHLGSWAIALRGDVAIPQDAASRIPMTITLDSSMAPVESSLQPWKGKLRIGGYEVVPDDGDTARVETRFHTWIYAEWKQVSPRRIEFLFRGTKVVDGRKGNRSGELVSFSMDEHRKWTMVIAGMDKLAARATVSRRTVTRDGNWIRTTIEKDGRRIVEGGPIR